MPDFTSEIEINVEEFWDECSRHEREELVDLLEEQGYVKRAVPKGIKPSHYTPNLMEIEWDETMDKLSQLRLRITRDEEDMIKNLVNKYY